VVDIYKYVQIKTALIILEDGVELSRKSNRYVLSPDADISGEDAEVQAVCNAVWTDEVKAAYEEFTSNDEFFPSAVSEESSEVSED